ncbi:uncharacterized protein LOC114959219 [Acropora millepora]|uniref:uncharacterized protein LOC114959219 n=1 Tax=Acropora millepora TaxID=45264 RepID=UPI001CF52317|nr:uncharacterized protein LOC114959219 [Acropora millepora]
MKGDTTFDVTMGSYDGAETCEPVGSFLLSQLQDLNINVGFYRDDGLTTTSTTPRDTENIKKEICRIFNRNGLRITIEANKKIVSFQDVTFNLKNSTYRPYTKPNTTLQYLHRESNHPPITTKNIPARINKRLSSLSSDKASFDNAAPRSKKHLTKADITTPSTTNPPRQPNAKTDSKTTFSCKTLHSARTSVTTSDTNSSA